MFVEAHLNQEEIEKRFHQASDKIAKMHWLILKLAHSGNTAQSIANVVGYGRDWVAKIVSRYNHHGPDSLGDMRQHNKGQKTTLTSHQLDELAHALEGMPEDGGRWNSTKVAQWMQVRVNHKVLPQHAWRYMRRAGFTLQRPRPHHEKADPNAQEQFKKKTYLRQWKRSKRLIQERR